MGPQINYDVNYFIKKFEAIPEKLWCNKNLITKRLFSTTFYAQGHCLGEDEASYITDKIKKARKELPSFDLIIASKSYPEWNALINLLQDNDRTKLTVGLINNGDHPDYQQPTPKQRVLKALYGIKAKEEQKTYISLLQEVESKPFIVTLHPATDSIECIAKKPLIFN